MAALAGSFYLISTVAFCLCCTVMGVRLVRLSRRTGARPELYLGCSLFLTGGVGYGLVIASAVARSQLHVTSPWLAVAGLGGLGLHHLGVLGSMAFVVTVFRPTERWARVFAGAGVAVLWTSWVLLVLEGGALASEAGRRWYWVGFAVTGTYPFWFAFESIRYWELMRRRRALGLADPVVTNRFLLIATASILGAAAIWCAAAPGLIGLPPDEQMRVAPFFLSVTAFLGIGAMASYWHAVFPPGWYLRSYRAAAH
jgi:hypothetical protein